jgi:hypothetical protein
VERAQERVAPRPVIVLCEIADGGALWAASELQMRGRPCEILFGPVLGAAPRIEHRLDAAGETSVLIGFPDGREISSASPQPIFNRLMAAPVDRLHATGGQDFAYAMQEVFALHLSWLNAWPGTVINRPSPQGLCGYFRHPSQWVGMAVQAGLNVAPWNQSEADGAELAWEPRQVDARSYVVDGRVVLPEQLPSELSAPCARLAAASGSALIEIDFARNADRWDFVTASPMPALHSGGAPLIDALAQALA